jgi:hypothetical protein
VSIVRDIFAVIGVLLVASLILGAALFVIEEMGRRSR